jgi:hypothetical protein
MMVINANVISSVLLLLSLTLIESIEGSKSTASPFLIRGGASVATASAATNNSNALRQYRMQQSHLLQLRSTFLSEALSQRGISIGPTLQDVATKEGAKPPQQTDWDCCVSTLRDPKSCLYSFDAEPDTKVICPAGTEQYISLKALNRLRRTDPSKVEPMWHSQFAILNSWFGNSEYSLMQFIGLKGFFVSNILLDLGKGMALKTLLGLASLLVFCFMLPILEIVMSRFLTCSPLWMKWMAWGRFVHAALPLKILLGQMAWKSLAGSFGRLEGFVRDYIVELECIILEESIPCTVASGDTVGEDDGAYVSDGDGVYVSDDVSADVYNSDNESEADYDFDDEDY